MILGEDKMGLVETAIVIATGAHAGQTRKDSGGPYILHPLRVMNAVHQTFENVPDYVLAAAVCHDVIEDCKHVPGWQIVDTIGLKAKSLVDELTNASVAVQFLRNSRAERKAIDLKKLETTADRVSAEDAEWVHRIKCLDRIDNLHELARTSKDQQWMRKYMEESVALWRVVGCHELQRGFSESLNAMMKASDKLLEGKK